MKLREMVMTRKKLAAVSILGIFALIISLATSYAYGLWFSHDRYWSGTIGRVQATEARLVRSMLSEMIQLSHLDHTEFSRMFLPLDGKIIVEISRDAQVLFSNRNVKFEKGDVLETFSLPDGRFVNVSGYLPPTWNYIFVRWLANPLRWFEPSFDYVTFPFLWFLLVYLLALFAVGFAVKSSYLEHDVLVILRRITERNES